MMATLSHPMGEGASLGRETKGEVVLVSRLRAALERLNASRMGLHALPPEAITAAVDELTRDRSAMSLEAGTGCAGVSRKGGKMRLRMFTQTGMFTET